jgi:hypothetical protein
VVEGRLVTISPVARRAGILLGEPSWSLLVLEWSSVALSAAVPTSLGPRW